jgi:hypothetical protein
LGQRRLGGTGRAGLGGEAFDARGGFGHAMFSAARGASTRSLRWMTSSP